MPAGQETQLEAELAEYVPASHVEHVVADTSEYVPAAHVAVTDTRPDESQYEPAGQLMQAADPDKL